MYTSFYIFNIFEFRIALGMFHSKEILKIRIFKIFKHLNSFFIREEVVKVMFVKMSD